MAPRAVLVGLPGSGKSTIGRRLAKAMGLTLLDTDAAIEETTGRTIADIFATDGEPEFRRIEEEVIRSALQTHDGVLSLGGGAVTTPGVREALARHTVIYLEISAAEGVRRTSGSTVRPLLAGADRAEKYKALMDARVPLYRRVATMRVNTNRRNPGAVVRHIVTRLDRPAPATSEANPAAATNRPRRRRRPPWRRDAAREQAAEHTDGPPTPAVMAARRAGRTPGGDSDTTMEKNT
ncbi:shikimate kinase [Mycolicibacterium litorale]|uniref:Shikimate kinase n=1 Tax=Mycolicibacterium litorale TaxID=758802 RepID=A0AAD1IRC9_9MYCO|nr:shikimate kinase [Mycolicibacterium litorale]MCV7415148.1 shikimate kinase [Mycolicibacterium litorale]TDY08399.1 shikimate kinase [Mycolicibacterium litorale]BBY16323.1 shikimate kinase [Mycolicibacterium litorale]